MPAAPTRAGSLPPVRPATETIHAPPFPRGLEWLGTAALRVDKQLGRPLVIGFWDLRIGASVRTTLTLERWHRAFAPRGARVIAVHVTGHGEPATVSQVAAVAERHHLTLPIVLDEELRIAESYGISGVPSRYVFDQSLKLVDAHFGLGAEADSTQLLEALVAHGERELAAQASQPEPAAPAGQSAESAGDESCDQGAAVPAAKQPRLLVHPPARESLPVPLPDPAPLVQPIPAERVAGDSRGPYEAGGVWLELRGRGRVLPAGGLPIEVTEDGTYLLQGDGVHRPGIVDFTLEGDVVCDAIQLEPGTAA